MLGLWFQETEGAKFWMQVLTELRQHGVGDILSCCIDGLKGFPEAIEAIFPQTVVQTCIVHLIRRNKSQNGEVSMLSLWVNLVTDHRRSRRCDGLKSC